MNVLPGLVLAAALAFFGHYLSDLIGVDLMGLPKSPIRDAESCLPALQI